MKINLPTKITLSRILAVPLIVVLFYLSFPFHYLAAAIVFVLAAATDMVDGHLARKRNEVTPLGKVLDPIADKILACFVMIMEAASGDMMFFYPCGVILSMVIVGREILIGAFRTLAAHKGAILAADKLGKLKTILLNVSLPIIMVGSVHIAVKSIGNVIFALAALFTVISGVNYVVKNKHIFTEGGNQ